MKSRYLQRDKILLRIGWWSNSKNHPRLSSWSSSVWSLLWHVSLANCKIKSTKWMWTLSLSEMKLERKVRQSMKWNRECQRWTSILLSSIRMRPPWRRRSMNLRTRKSSLCTETKPTAKRSVTWNMESTITGVKVTDHIKHIKFHSHHSVDWSITVQDQCSHSSICWTICTLKSWRSERLVQLQIIRVIRSCHSIIF